MQRALQALAMAIESTRRYFSLPWASESDWIAQAELAEHWANAASCLAGVEEWSLARKCLRNVQCWQQLVICNFSSVGIRPGLAAAALKWHCLTGK